MPKIRSTKSASTKSRKSKHRMIPNVLRDIRPEFVKELGLCVDDFDNVRLFVITGDNASGKSFLRRIFHQFLKDPHKVELIPLSQEARATGGITRAFVYGSEGDESTGMITAGTFVKGFKTSRARETDHVLLWDEPEIGLSEEAQLGAGAYFVEQLEEWPLKMRGMIVMTHSRWIVKALMAVDGAKFINVGGKYKTAQEWLDRSLKPVSPSQITDGGWEKFQRLSKMLRK